MYSFRLQQLGIKLVCLHHVVALSPLSGRDATSLNESPLQPHDGTGALRWEILANHVLPSRHFPPKSEFEFNPPSPIAIPPKFRATRRPVMSLRRFGDSFSRQRLRANNACLLAFAWVFSADCGERLAAKRALCFFYLCLSI